jgi:cytochrome c-type biogenesis protein
MIAIASSATVAQGSTVGEAFATAVTSGPLLVAIAAAMAAGLISFASPCVIPLVPGYLSYLAGLVGAEAPKTAHVRAPLSAVTRGRAPSGGGRLRVAGAALLFVAGFTAVFVAATATVFGITSSLLINRELIQRAGGVITIVMGLAFVGWIPLLQRDTRFAPRPVTTIAGAPLLGGVFALGWTPCLGPTLAAVIATASGTEGATAAKGIVLVVAYCLGLGMPFVALAFSSAWALRSLRVLRAHSRSLQILGGVLMLAVGIAMITGVWDHFVTWVRDAFVTNTQLPI